MKEILRGELERRKQRNPAYSLRAFAKSLKMSPAQLSQIVSGKRPLTLKAFDKISRELALSPLEKKMALDSLTRQALPEIEPAHLNLKEDEFKVIADWQHFAILSLARLKGARKDPVWVAKRLGLQIIEAKNALDRLERMGILAAGPELKRLAEPIRVISAIPSQAIQKSHRQTLQLASDRLSQVELEKRDYSAMTMAIDPKNLAKAKQMIENFQEELGKLLEKGQPSEVYTFACQLFPLTIQSEISKGK